MRVSFGPQLQRFRRIGQVREESSENEQFNLTVTSHEGCSTEGNNLRSQGRLRMAKATDRGEPTAKTVKCGLGDRRWLYR